jgi:uncharacterized tellurite resistance protein B-like protein
MGAGGAMSPELGCAGLAIAAARRGGDYTEVEADRANAALMKLLMITRPQATALRKDAEDLRRSGTALGAFAEAARGLPKDACERLITQLWALSGEGATAEDEVMRAVTHAFGMDKARIETLRPLA